MALIPIITFRDVRPSAGLEKLILDRTRKLETYVRRIVACRVLVEFLERRHRTGKQYHVRIDLTVPGEDILVNNDPGHQDARVAIREAFDLARRQLQDHARRQRGAVKVHRAVPSSHVVRLRGRPACRLRLG